LHRIVNSDCSVEMSRFLVVRHLREQIFVIALADKAGSLSKNR
jgi:hypothetical protein